MPKYDEEDDDDEGDDESFVFDKDRVSVEVGVEFDGLHNISLCTDVNIRLSDPIEASQRLQKIINMLKKGIPACEYTEGNLTLNEQGQIDNCSVEDDEGLEKE